MAKSTWQVTRVTETETPGKEINEVLVTGLTREEANARCKLEPTTDTTYCVIEVQS